MKQFGTIREAFDWWIREYYPNLPSNVKKGKPVAAWRDYHYGRGISEERMRKILIEFGDFEITLKIIHKP
jgi:hypothetical protein